MRDGQHEESSRRDDLRTDLVEAARTLSTVTLVGMVCGALVVGVLGRLAMMLLAGLNPEATGIRSDDGFPIGEFTLSGSLQLTFAGLQLGITGAFVYVALRGLMVGPAWFRMLSISLGPALVIGALIVHTDGVDFTVLDPPWLAALLFVAIPAVFVALLHLLAERLLGSGWVAPTPLLVLGLVPWVPLFPLTLVLLAGFWSHRALRRTDRGRSFLASPWPAWTVRAVLAALVVRGGRRPGPRPVRADLRNRPVPLPVPPGHHAERGERRTWDRASR